MKRLIIILGFESSGSVFCGRVISYVLDKCSRFGEWKGYGWNGNIGDDLVIIHRSMPYGRKKKWMEELLEEISDMKNYSKEFIICTRDLNISKISRISRFGGDWSEYLRDDERATKIFSKIIKDENYFIFSYESAAALGGHYYITLYNWLKVESTFFPPFFDRNAPYINNRNAPYINKFGKIIFFLKNIFKQIKPIKNQKIESTDERYELNFKKIIIDESKYFVPIYAMHRPAVNNISTGKLYEPTTHKFVETLCEQKSGSIIHAGTFFGDMLPNFSKFVNGSVYAFEPVLENFILAKLSVDVNKLSNVILINSALSSSVSNLRINTSQNGDLHAGGASSISEHGQICASLKIDSLDTSDIILIQLDVEGHELDALSGATNTIARCRPIIAIEDNYKRCDNFLFTNDYSIARKIPGLTIWAPNEDSLAFELSKSF